MEELIKKTNGLTKYSETFFAFGYNSSFRHCWYKVVFRRPRLTPPVLLMNSEGRLKTLTLCVKSRGLKIQIHIRIGGIISRSVIICKLHHKQSGKSPPTSVVNYP